MIITVIESKLLNLAKFLIKDLNRLTLRKLLTVLKYEINKSVYN